MVFKEDLYDMKPLDVMLREIGCVKGLRGPFGIRSSAIMAMFWELNKLIDESRSIRQRVGNNKEEAKAYGAALK